MRRRRRRQRYHRSAPALKNNAEAEPRATPAMTPTEVMLPPVLGFAGEVLGSVDGADINDCEVAASAACVDDSEGAEIAGSCIDLALVSPDCVDVEGCTVCT